MKKSLPMILMIFLFESIALAQTIPTDSLYFGQSPPGSTPLLFAPGIISLPERAEYGISISLDGSEMLFAIGNWPDKRTMIVEYADNHWSSPDTVSFSKMRSADEAIYSPDGQRVYYYAYDLPGSFGGADLCYSIKNDSTWGEPLNMGSPLNTIQDEYHPCVVADSSIYFENASGKICYSKYQNGNYLPRLVMPVLFNDQGNSWGNPYVAPDESYFIFNSTRAGGFGGSDLYISYRKNDGSWTNPKNLGNIINTSAYECGSEITDDSLYMTYVSNNDIYWVGSGFIDSLRYTNFVPYVLHPIPDQHGSIGQFFSFTVPDSTFFDDDTNDVHTYFASLSNGNNLPDWLSFDSITATFYCTPGSIQTLNIKVKCIDDSGAFVSTTFKIKIGTTSLGLHEASDLIIFPNPTNGLATISLGRFPDRKIVAEIFDLEGKVIHNLSFRKSVTFDMSDYPKGLYIIRLHVDNELIVSKIGVQ
jgi:hypothetical protein